MWYPVVRLVARLVFRVVNRMRVTPRTSIALEGPLVIVANHESFLDGLALAAAFPARRLTFLSASYLFDQPLVGTFLRAMGALPVQDKANNVASLKHAIAILRQGGTVAVFPEGGIARSAVLGGAAYLALKADVPVLGACLKGTRAALPPGAHVLRPRAIEVALDRPFYLSRPAAGSAGMRQAVSDGTVALEFMLERMRSDRARRSDLPAARTTGATT